ncbi:MAG: nitroreductase family deazaflavin-dependent oxidoreductase [Chloroflexi bacterium]|nr:nitroreductase family deazaflavin-dependent oxidoreductase [Chloroflexota bacterium]
MKPADRRMQNRKRMQAMFRVVNPLMKTILRSPLHRLVSGQIMLLSFTGRKSGRRYTTPVGYVQDGTVLFIFTQSAWWKNLRDGAPVKVRLRERTADGTATATDDPEQVAAGLRAFIDDKGPDALFRLGVSLDAQNPTHADLVTAAEGHRLVRIALDE